MLVLALLAPACAPEREPVTRHARARGGDPALDTADPGEDTADTGADTDTGTDTDPGEPGPLLGVDVSHWQGDVDWVRAYADGVRFAWFKATEGSYFEDDQSWANFDGAAAAGVVRAGYHFANPSYSGGAEQAAYFLDRGGDWTADGLTLPGALDFEWNPYDGDDCYDMSPDELAEWIHDFDDAYVLATGRHVAIYTSSTYWGHCVGDSSFGEILPLWVAQWSGDAPTLPQGWSSYTAWQYGNDGSVDGISTRVDVNRFEGSTRDLRDFALGR